MLFVLDNSALLINDMHRMPLMRNMQSQLLQDGLASGCAEGRYTRRCSMCSVPWQIGGEHTAQLVHGHATVSLHGQEPHGNTHDNRHICNQMTCS